MESIKMRANKTSLLLSIFFLTSNFAYGHARGDFDKFGGNYEDVKVFRGLLSEKDGLLTEEALAYWLRKGGHLEPDLFTDGGDPKKGVLRFRKIESRSGEDHPIVERWIVEVKGDDGILRPKYEVVRGPDGKKIAKDNQQVNQDLTKWKWSSKEDKFNDLPRLGKLETALAYKQGFYKEPIFLLFVAPEGVRSSLLLGPSNVDNNEAKTTIRYAGKAIGSLHRANAKNLDNKDEANAPNKLETLTHGDLIENNVWVDLKAKKHKVTLANLERMGIGKADEDIEDFLGHGGLSTRAAALLEAIHAKKDLLDEDPNSSNAGRIREELTELKAKFGSTIGLIEEFADAYASEFPEKVAPSYKIWITNKYAGGLKKDFEEHFGMDGEKRGAPSKKHKGAQKEMQDVESSNEAIPTDENEDAADGLDDGFGSIENLDEASLGETSGLETESKGSEATADIEPIVPTEQVADEAQKDASGTKETNADETGGENNEDTSEGNS
jgi:hypothetical protein